MFDEHVKKRLLRQIPHPVVICGCTDGAGAANAFTLTWITQTSFDPPVVAIAVRNDTRSNRLIRGSNVFSVNFPGRSQVLLAETFTRSSAGNEKLDDVAWHPGVTGCPILDDCLGAFECNVIGIVEHGDHDVVVGEIIATEGSRSGEPPLLLSDTDWEYAG